MAISRAGGIDRVAVEPARARAPVAAVEALVDADQIVLGPGSLYTSVLAAAVVDEVRLGIAPDVVVTQAGGLPLGGLAELGAGVEVVRADVARPPGMAHDGAKLAGVLAELVP